MRALWAAVVDDVCYDGVVDAQELRYAEWDESLHPRDNGGVFTDVGQSQFQSESLSSDDEAAIRFYTENSTTINETLREGGADLSRDVPFFYDILALDDAVNKGTIAAPVEVYREIGKDVVAGLNQGDTFHEYAFTSTTKSRERAYESLGTTREVVAIRLQRGDRALDVSDRSLFPEEQEVLLPRDQSFVVVGKHEGILVLEPRAVGERMAAEFDESRHPRDKTGEFIDKGGSGSGRRVEAFMNELIDKWDSGGGEESATVPLSFISLSKAQAAGAREENKSGTQKYAYGSLVTKETNLGRPIELFYNTTTKQLIVQDGVHRILDALDEGKQGIEAVFEVGPSQNTYIEPTASELFQWPQWLRGAAEFDEVDHPRDRGGKFTDKSGGDVSVSSRVERALATYKPSTRAIQRQAAAGEAIIARALGGRDLEDNEPMDVIVEAGGRTAGVEVKTLIDNAHDKITMHPESRRRKEAWVRKNKASGHTVVVDRRTVGAPAYYYKAGFGAFRLAGMDRVTLAELRDRIAAQPRAAGGAGSGNFDHAGRPGEVGGSAPSGDIGSYVSGGDRLTLDESRAAMKQFGERYKTDSNFKGAADVVSLYAKATRDHGLLTRGIVEMALRGKTAAQIVADPKAQKLLSNLNQNLSPEYHYGPSDIEMLVAATPGYYATVRSVEPTADAVYRGMGTVPKGDEFELRGPTAFTANQDIALSYSTGALMEVRPGAKMLPVALLSNAKATAEGDEFSTVPAFQRRSSNEIHPKGVSYGFAIDFDTDRELNTAGRFKVVERKEKRLLFRDAKSGKERLKTVKVVVVEQVGVF